MSSSRPNARIQYENALKYTEYRMPTPEEWVNDYDAIKKRLDKTESLLRIQYEAMKNAWAEYGPFDHEAQKYFDELNKYFIENC